MLLYEGLLALQAWRTNASVNPYERVAAAHKVFFFFFIVNADSQGCISTYSLMSCQGLR